MTDTMMTPSLLLPHSESLGVEARAFVVGPVPFDLIFDAVSPACSATHGCQRRVQFSRAIAHTHTGGNCHAAHHPDDLTTSASATEGPVSIRTHLDLYSQRAPVCTYDAHTSAFKHNYLVYVQEHIADAHLTLAGFVATSDTSCMDEFTTHTLVGGICISPEFQMHNFAWNVMQFIKRRTTRVFSTCKSHYFYADQKVHITSVVPSPRRAIGTYSRIVSAWNFRNDNGPLLELCELGFRPAHVITSAPSVADLILVRWVMMAVPNVDGTRVVSDDVGVANCFPLMVCTTVTHTPSTRAFMKCAWCNRNAVERIDRRTRIAVIGALDALFNTGTSRVYQEKEDEVAYTDTNDPVRYTPTRVLDSNSNSNSNSNLNSNRSNIRVGETRTNIAWNMHGLARDM